MEAIMSEIFNDTTTAFYVILCKKKRYFKIIRDRAGFRLWFFLDPARHF